MEKERKRFDSGNIVIDEFIGIAWNETRWFRPFLFVFCREKALVADLRQTILMAATECWAAGLDPKRFEDRKAAWGICQKAIYRFLTSQGLRIPRGRGIFVSREVAIPEKAKDMSQTEIATLLEISEQAVRKSQNTLFWTNIQLSVSDKEWLEISGFLFGDGKKISEELRQKLEKIVNP